jgi:hypothetical protein
VRVDQATADVQSESDSTRRATVRFNPIKGVEQVRDVIGADARAVVANGGHQHAVTIGVDFDSNLAAAR